MKIPSYTEKNRYYVAQSLTECFSSWDTLIEAKDSFEKMKNIYPEDTNQVIGILRVNKHGKSWAWQKPIT
jgi:hypothetical protein